MNRTRRGRVGRPPIPPEAMERRIGVLADAVRDRRVVELLYGGAWRVVHPHAVGRLSTGNVGLLTWQTAGLARGPDSPGEGWRMFDVSRIEDARILHSTFAPRPRRNGFWTRNLPHPAAEAPSREEALAAA